MTSYKQTNELDKNLDTNLNKSLASRDLKLIQLDKEIQNKKKFILSKIKELESKKTENDHLETISDDYKKYFNHTVEQKEKEFNAMVKLNEYISKLVFEDPYAKYDQKEVQKEINKLKRELNDIHKSK